jgi:hypothetical protein
MQKDNSTFKQKVALRLEALASCREPTVLETHGGAGKVFAACYSRFTRGVVFEVDPDKAETLAAQRPSWSVYQSPCETVLEAGGCAERSFNFLDCDPYGSPFPALGAFFGTPRAFPESMHLVVNDGLRQKVKLGGAWQTHDLRELVQEFGNDLYGCYMAVAKEKIRRLVKAAGYAIESWKGYHCGHGGDMTHYWAALKRSALSPA